MTDSSDYIGELERCEDMASIWETIMRSARERARNVYPDSLEELQEDEAIKIAEREWLNRFSPHRGRDSPSVATMKQVLADERATWADHFRAMGWAPPEEVEELRAMADVFRSHFDDFHEAVRILSKTNDVDGWWDDKEQVCRNIRELFFSGYGSAEKSD